MSSFNLNTKHIQANEILEQSLENISHREIESNKHCSKKISKDLDRKQEFNILYNKKIKLLSNEIDKQKNITDFENKTHSEKQKVIKQQNKIHSEINSVIQNFQEQGLIQEYSSIHDIFFGLLNFIGDETNQISNILNDGKDSLPTDNKTSEKINQICDHAKMVLNLAKHVLTQQKSMLENVGRNI